MHRDLSLTRMDTLEHELQEAVVGTVLQLGRAARRYAHHRRRHGYDYGCRRLLDEFRLSRSLLMALVDEIRATRGSRAARC